MAEDKGNVRKECPCSQGINRRGFMKITAAAGLLAGCAPVVNTSAAGEESTAAAEEPTPAPGQTAVPDLSGKKALYVLPRNAYAEQCHEDSVSVLKSCGMEILLTAIEKKAVLGFGEGSPVLTPDLALSEVNVEEFDAVIFECGTPMENYNPDYQNLARETVAQDKVLAAVCMMPSVLAASGVLKGKQATSNLNDQYNLEQYGAILSEANAVRDGKIVTASFEGTDRFGWLIAEALTA
jgi:protease I